MDTYRCKCGRIINDHGWMVGIPTCGRKECEV